MEDGDYEALLVSRSVAMFVLGPWCFLCQHRDQDYRVIKCHSSGPATAGSTGDSGANIYGRQLVINWMVAEMPS